jgi:amidase
MLRNILGLALLLILVGCKESKQPIEQISWEPYNESADIAAQQEHETQRMRYKLINSKLLDKNTIWSAFSSDLAEFTDEQYLRLKPLILEQNIPTIQKNIAEKKLTYEELVTFYVYRIRLFESDNTQSLNAIIALNKDAIKEARILDANFNASTIDYNSLKGMPILLKDNIGATGMMTTAGALALKDNKAGDAFITKKLKASGAIILGKANLSEWAYFFCSGCPVGYSAIGGQTMNPYGRMLFESGGSSSGSGASIAANFAVAAVGTETSGSILSPSSQNSLVGLKPTIGVLSRTGIIPISSTLDTPGPMTKSIIDNAIMLNGMLGKDKADAETIATVKINIDSLSHSTIVGKRFGVISSLLENEIYKSTVTQLKTAGAIIVEFTPPEVALDGFRTLLNIDMKNDLPFYLIDHASDNIKFKSVADIVAFNKEELGIRAPYGQQLFEGIVADSTTQEQLEGVKESLQTNGRLYFDTALNADKLDAILSINNYHAGYAAVAKYPALALPMGYKESGEPINLSLIVKPYQESKLLQLGAGIEKVLQARKTPKNYQ